ncbi:nuclear transport factor 2 family protein [Phaeobacter sp. C3_T13_0]|uniref:nuclear transport factor 2 family protein n=1 Tax=Phaeobacter cretensis TaxID=3342641 RepID=UPI0039BC36CD
MPNGRDALVEYMGELAESGTQLSTEVAKTIAMGDMVVVHSKETDLNKNADLGIGYMDIFRFNDDGQIVEHWDIEEAQTGETANENDVFGYPND